VIRPFSFRDVGMLRQLESQGAAFDLRRWLLGAPSSTLSALAGYLTQYHMGTVTCVQDGRGRRGAGLRGFVQAWPRWNHAEWDLAYMSPALDYRDGAGDLWQELLSALILHGAEQNIDRIYARLTEDGESEEIFRHAGFTILTREEIFVLSRDRTPAILPKGLRRTSPDDRPGLEEFYRQVAPRLQSKIEWATPSSVVLQYPWPHSWIRDDYMWSDKGKILAHFRLLVGSRGAWLEVVVRPEHRADILPCLKYMTALPRRSHATPLYCPVPDYGVGLGWLLRTLGFEPFARQVLLVAHTIACVPVTHRLVVPGLNTQVETSIH